jgi:hypothetical protein
MLRPACSLLVARLSPSHELLTPRSGSKVSLRYLGPATRRSDAYRCGTLTRWKSAACAGRTSARGKKNVRRVTTHHDGEHSSFVHFHFRRELVRSCSFADHQ